MLHPFLRLPLDRAHRTLPWTNSAAKRAAFRQSALLHIAQPRLRHTLDPTLHTGPLPRPALDILTPTACAMATLTLHSLQPFVAEIGRCHLPALEHSTLTGNGSVQCILGFVSAVGLIFWTINNLVPLLLLVSARFPSDGHPQHYEQHLTRTRATSRAKTPSPLTFWLGRKPNSHDYDFLITYCFCEKRNWFNFSLHF